jgi:hypothetical protein
MIDIKKIKWVKYGNHQGCQYHGSNQYNPPKPWGPWTRILGVVARCEGNHDTVVSYDNTAITWGFMQWTFTSGRLQKLLESFKSIPFYDFSDETAHPMYTLFDVKCPQFSEFGFHIRGGRFIDRSLKVVFEPGKDNKKMNDICLGRVAFPNQPQKQKTFAKRLAAVFGDLGSYDEVAAAQIQFAKQELKRSLDYTRKPLGEIGTIRNLISQSDKSWELPIAAVFFNLWQNSPKGAYMLYKNAWKDAKKRGISDKPGHLIEGSENGFLNLVWERVNKTKFANWGWNSKRYKANPRGVKPRVYRIKLAIKEFYGIDLPFIK